MSLLILGLVLLLGAHTFTTRRAARAAAVERLGEGPYKGLYSLVSLLGLALIVYGFRTYREAGYIQVWDPPTGMRHLTLLLMWPAMICLVAAYVPGSIKRVLKHPMLGGEDMGLRPFAGQRRSWLHRALRLRPGLGGV